MSRVSAHAGQNRDVCLSAHGCLPRTLRYTQIKIRGQGSLELAQETKKKERKKDWEMAIFFEYLVLACTIVLMNGLDLDR